MLLHKSHNESRDHQRQYLVQLGGEGTVRELDYHLGIAANNGDAVRKAERLDQELDGGSNPSATRICASVSRAVCWFTQAAISGKFGPDDSRDGRSAVFLKHPWVIARAVEIFLENLLVDKDGIVVNHEIAEQRAAEFIGEQCW
jgi:hypothetical protein